jgi:hypothetical protein
MQKKGSRPSVAKKPKPSTGKGKPGPKLTVIDWEQVKELCKIQCTQEEIARVIGCDLDTIGNRCKTDLNIQFSEFFQQNKENGRSSLRRRQWLLSETAPAMAIWLGKQWLGQKDKQEDDEPENQNVTINFNVTHPAN